MKDNKYNFPTIKEIPQEIEKYQPKKYYKNIKPYFEEIPHEYECGGFGCTPGGCPGHESNQPIGFDVDSVIFFVEGFEGGDFPGSDKEWNQHVKRVIKKIKLCIEQYNENNLR